MECYNVIREISQVEFPRIQNDQIVSSLCNAQALLSHENSSGVCKYVRRNAGNVVC